MSSKEYDRQYKRDRKKTHRSVTLEYTNEEHAEIKVRAELADRPVATQIKAENNAYIAGYFLPTKTIIDRLDQIIRLLRNIANNLNQIAHHSNQVQKLLSVRQVFKLLRKIEIDVVKLVRSAWRPTK